MNGAGATASADAPGTRPTTLVFVALFAAAAALVAVPFAAFLFSDRLAIAIVGGGAVLASALAAAALHRPRADGSFGVGRGAAVAMLAYATSFVIVMPLQAVVFGTFGRRADAAMLAAIPLTGLLSFVYTPLPWLAMAVGAGIGWIAPARCLAAAARARAHAERLGGGARRDLAQARDEVVRRSTAMRALPLEGIAGIAAFVAALAGTFLALTRGPAFAGGGEAALLVFPAAVAFAAALAAWLAARRLAALLSPGWRVVAALAAVSLAAAGAAAVATRLDL